MTISLVEKHTNSLERITDWFDRAIPEPNHLDVMSQLGIHMDEIVKLLNTIIPSGISEEAKEKLNFAADVMQFISLQIKTSEAYELDLSQVDREKLLEALTRQVVSSVGIAQLMGMSFPGALDELAASNDSKFDADGKPKFTANNKLVRSQGYFKPDFKKFVL